MVLAECAALQLHSKQGCGHASCSFPLVNGSEPQQHLMEVNQQLHKHLLKLHFAL